MKISEILQRAGFVCSHPPHRGNESKFITYQYVGQVDTLYAEGVPCEFVSIWAIDFYTNESFTHDVRVIIAALLAGGYTCILGPELYEPDTKLYHLALTATGVGAEEY